MSSDIKFVRTLYEGLVGGPCDKIWLKSHEASWRSSVFKLCCQKERRRRKKKKEEERRKKRAEYSTLVEID